MEIKNSQVEPWVARFLIEYEELLERSIKLDNMLVNWDNLNFKPKCSFELLEQQSMVMHQYLKILEWRAKIEDIREIYVIQRKYISGLTRTSVK